MPDRSAQDPAPGQIAAEPGFRLAEAIDAGEAPALVARAEATKLDALATSRVTDRLPPLAAEPRVEPFALREPSLPPPRPGRTERTPFPPATASASAPEAPRAGPLTVLRRSPEGDVALAASLSVTFSQPMVALDSQAGLARAEVPVRLEPQPKGEWRWVGTRTLVFEPEGRLAMATEYRATVAAGTKSATGGALARDVSWSFRTPPPRLVSRHPEGGPVRRDALMFAGFDQRIDQAAVLARVRVRAAGALQAVRLATASEVEQDPVVARLSRSSEPGRWLAFRTESPLPQDAAVEVSVGPGTPSAEGTRKSESSERFAFRTYGPFRVRKSQCGWNERCTPSDPWQIELTNPIDAKSVAPEVVRVEPELPGLKVESWGQTLAVRGVAKGRTRYRVSLSSALRDAFGQALEAAAPLTFDVGPAPQTLRLPGGDFLVLDPAGAPSLPVYSTNHPSLRVQAYAVTPEDWPAWHEYRRRDWRKEPARPPGRPVLDTTVRVAGEPDALTETRIDLGPALADGLGQLVVSVRPTQPVARDASYVPALVWVQATRIGLDAFADGETLLAWANDLASGQALAGVELSLGGVRGRTPESGLARLALADAPAPLLVARRGKDVAILPQQTSWWSQEAGWRRHQRQDALRFFVFDDRRLYRPGEEVRVKGWLRRIGAGPTGDVEALPGALRSLAWTLVDSQGNESARGNAGIAATGGFDLALALPPTFNLGPASLRLVADVPEIPHAEYVHGFSVQEFRRPEFEVKAAASDGPHLSGESATVTVTASYFAGGALPGAEVSWNVSARPGSFRPPNRDDFVFGRFVPWWRPLAPARETEQRLRFASRTDGGGRHRLRIDFEREAEPRPRVFTAEATVIDVNRQAWTAQSSLLVHAASRYVGLRSERSFVQRGEPIVLDAIATDLEGQASPGSPIRVVAERLEWEQVQGEWQEVAHDRQERELPAAAEPTRVRLDTREGGVYRLLARVADAKGRENETELRVWVAGGRVEPRRALEQDEVTLVPDRREYQPGDVAKLLVVAPFAPAEGVLTLRRGGLLREERFTIAGGSTTLAIPIEDGFTPNVHVQVDLVGAAPRDGVDAGRAHPNTQRPAFATGRLELPVPPRKRTLALAVAPREPALEPGGATVLDLSLRDAAGAPAANAEAAVAVVDEAVLALTGYRVPDPLGVFYSPRGADVTDHRLRSHVMLALPDSAGETVEVLAQAAGVAAMSAERMPAAAPMRRMAAREKAEDDESAAPIRARTDFSATALFAASVRFDAAGRASVPVKLPDSLTRYRVMAVAVSGPRRFGSGEATLVARLPLMVRPSPPRFLNFGDRFELPVVVQNQTDREMTVDVAVRARNAALTDGAGRRLVVAANDRAEVRFPMAAERAGSARIQVGGVSGSSADAAEVELPVWTPATTEAFATYGELDAGSVAQPVRAPEGARPEVGGLELTTSSTALQALTDAVLYLTAYPFECAEQLSSRVLAVAALRDVLGAFQAEGLPKPEELEQGVRRDVDRLRALQNDDGGFGFWRRGDASWPYVSIHVAHALARAKAKGIAVPADVLERSHGYLREIDGHIPKEYGTDVRRTLQAYAVSVRALLGDADHARARALVREATAEQLSFEALGWLLPLLGSDETSQAEAAAVRRRIANGVTETAGAAHFAVSYGDSDYLLLHSDRRADAILLEALVADQPKSDLVPKLVAGLLAHRNAGRWASTQENVFVLLALDRYFGAYERATPDFVARAWLGDRYAGSHAFRGRTTERQHTEVPMSVLRETRDTSDLLLSKEGPGRLYYRIGLRYAPQDLELAALDRGFTVERRYEGADQASDVRRDADGTWRVKAGARVRVRLTLVAEARRYHVALVDPLPAGLEALNPALATTGSLPDAGGDSVAEIGAPGLGAPRGVGHWSWRARTWFDHQNLRDDRVEAFAALLWDGVYSYRYVARATTPGTFVVPPPRAEEMYSPETFGRGASDRVVVE